MFDLGDFFSSRLDQIRDLKNRLKETSDDLIQNMGAQVYNMAQDLSEYRAAFVTSTHICSSLGQGSSFA